MSTVNQLVERITVLTREVRSSDEPVTEMQWDAFDANLHRFLVGTIGPQGSRVPTGEPCADILRELSDRYPHPLRSPGGRSPERNDDSARELGKPSTQGVTLPRRGALRLVAAPDPRESVTLPDATDGRPIARITCALGALADLVDVLEYQQVPDTSGVAVNTAHVLASAAIVARHTLACGPLAAGDRPLAVGNHVESALAAMQPLLESAPVRSFRGLPSVADVDIGDTSLDRAVSAWSYASEVELRARIPSTESLHMMVNQGAHITATLAEVVREAKGDDDRRGARADLVHASQALGAADKAWVPGLTSLIKPSADFITASRGLFLALEEVRARSDRFTEPEREQVAQSVGQAVATLSRRVAAARAFLQPLADGKALYAPARQVGGSPERLNDQLKGRYVTVEYFDIKDLDAAWRTAGVATQSATALLVRRTTGPDSWRAATIC